MTTMYQKEWMREIIGPRPVLLVDDDKNDCDLIQRGSREYNIDWFIANGEGQAIKCLEEHGQSFRLIFLDLNLGVSDNDGLNLFRQIKRRWPWLPVLVFSGGISDHTIDVMTKIGFVMFLKKPIEFNTKFFGELFFAFNITRRDGVAGMDVNEINI